MVVAKVVAKYPNTHRTAPKWGRVRGRGGGKRKMNSLNRLNTGEIPEHAQNRA